MNIFHGASELAYDWARSKKARTMAIVFIDEIDGLTPPRSGGGSDTAITASAVNPVLQVMEGYGKRDNVVVMAAQYGQQDGQGGHAHGNGEKGQSGSPGTGPDVVIDIAQGGRVEQQLLLVARARFRLDLAGLVVDDGAVLQGKVDGAIYDGPADAQAEGRLAQQPRLPPQALAQWLLREPDVYRP